MSIFKAIMERLAVDYAEYRLKQKINKHYRYWINKESAELAQKLADEIDEQMIKIHAHSHSIIQTSKREKDNV